MLSVKLTTSLLWGKHLSAKGEIAMRYLVHILLVLLLIPLPLRAAQSVITETEGYACMGDDKSRKATEEVALNDAKRKAAESAVIYIQAETHLKDGMLEKDLHNAYANAQVKVVQELEKRWYKDPTSGDCYKARLKVEVIPDDKAMANLAKKHQEDLESEPAAPLSVKVWTSRQAPRQGEKIKIYLKGNKPFFGRVVYRDASGNITQLLPNPYRQNSYFNGNATYELPSGEDRFRLEVCPPFGSEMITVYASTSPLGDLDVTLASGVYEIRTKPKDVGMHTRGIKISQESDAELPMVAEFAEAAVEIRTKK